MKKCENFVIENKGHKHSILSQSADHLAKVSKSSKSQSQHFKMFKHPDQKKYMHYALKNSEGEWLAWDQDSGKLKAGTSISWFAMLPVNENKPNE